MATVTVFIPTRDRAAWLGGAIDSVLAQTWRDFALVVSDNGSTDETPAVAARYADPRLSYVRRSGLDLNQHFNACLREASSPYVLLLPDDDRIAPDLLERAVPVLEGHPRVGMVHGQADVIDHAGESIARGHDMTGLHGDAVEPGLEFIRRSMRMGYRVHASTALIRSSAMTGLALEQEDYPLTDLGLWMRLALDWDVAFVARPLAQYRVHTQSYSSGAAAVTSGGYVQAAGRAVRAHEVKLRFLDAHGARLGRRAPLRRAADRALRRELLAHAADSTLPDRRLGDTARALAGCARVAPGIVREPAAARLLAGGVLGRRGVAALKSLRDRHTTSAGATA